MIPKTILEYLNKNRQRHLEKLFELLRIPSVSNNNDGSCTAAANWLKDFLVSLGFSVSVEGPAAAPNVFAQSPAVSGPTVLIYGHYDVQPAQPLELWHSQPFEPQVRDGKIFARGANDNKGQLFAHLMAVEAFVQTSTPLPVNIKFFFEGQEEVGSPELESYVQANADKLRADAIVISDSEFFAPGVPSITYGLRGVGSFEVTLIGANSDVHSGVHGGALANPIHALAKIVAAIHDENGRVTVEGFYDGVIELQQAERDEWSKLPFDQQQYAASLGVDHLGGGEKGFSVLERRWARPTLDANGIFGGYTGPGGKTIIPSQASVKLSIRTVPNQNPEKLALAIEKFIRQRTPAGMNCEFHTTSLNRPVLLAKDSPAMQAAKDALKEAFGQETAMIRCGASIPVTEMFQRILGVDSVMMGLGLPDDNLHAPNEKFDLEQLYKGSIASAAVLFNLAKARG